MSDYEELLEQFIKSEYSGRDGIWESCRCAYALFERFGAYSRDTVATLTQACHLGYDAIYNRKYAWEEYVRLHDPGRKPSLTASHYYRLRRLRQIVSITDDEAREYIELAESEGWSSGDLCREVQNNHDADPQKRFMRQVERMWRGWWKIWEDSATYDVPDNIRELIYQTLKAVEKWQKTIPN